MLWSIYVLKCSDGSLYTGIALDVNRRLKQHQSGKGSRYVRSRLPADLVYRETVKTRSMALKRECAIKSLPRKQKLKLLERRSPSMKAL